MTVAAFAFEEPGEPIADWWVGRLPVGDWAANAACRDRPLEWWFPVTAADVSTTGALAISICETCPVQADCLRHAITANEDHGIWGGKSERARLRIRRAARRRTA